MKKHIFFIIFGIFFVTTLNAQFYNDSARSTAMNGAHSATSYDAFEAMMFNPAGLAASQSKFGLHIMGTLGMNLYSNSFNFTTAVEILEQQNSNNNIESFVSKLRSQNLHTGVQAGFIMNYNLFKFFFHTKYCSLGFSDTLKMRGRTFLGDDLFSTVFDEINLNKKHSIGTVGADVMVYNDFNTSFSMYLWMLEHKTPLRGFYVGGGVHWYTPIIHASASLSGNIKKGHLSKLDDISQADTRLYTYDLELDGKVHLASPITLGWSELAIPFSNGYGIPFGLGFDLGGIVDFNKWVRAGFSVTDLGFMVSPSTDFDVDVDANIDLANIDKLGDEFVNVKDIFTEGGKGGAEAVLAPLAIRLGATVTPFSNNWIELECPLNFTITDFDLISLGFLPTFGFSTGVEFTLKAGFFQLPLWTSIGYFTSSGVSIGFGGGLHIGACHLDLGIRGLESLMAPPSDSAWGRDVAFALQMSFQIKKKAEDKAKEKRDRKLTKKAPKKARKAVAVDVQDDSAVDETVQETDNVPEEMSDTQESVETADVVETPDEQPVDEVPAAENVTDEAETPTIQLMQ
jgi:hypothetical protein